MTPSFPALTLLMQLSPMVGTDKVVAHDVVGLTRPAWGLRVPVDAAIDGHGAEVGVIATAWTFVARADDHVCLSCACLSGSMLCDGACAVRGVSCRRSCSHF